MDARSEHAASTLDAHLANILRLAREIDASREQFNVDMMRLLMPPELSVK